MERTHMAHLKEWLVSQDRKPLVMRGARQVGKTWLARQLATLCNKQLIEINIEKRPEIATLFASNNPSEILVNLEAAFEATINPETCILFLDEIQSAPELLGKLRWFAEDMPQLPLITAGSLLEFVLADHTFSMPVGRINYMYLEPLSFEEFLLANNKKILCDYLSSYNWGTVLPAAIHQQLIRLFKEYIIVGGLPAAVSSWVNDHSLIKVSQKHHDLLTTYRDDFAKYKGNIAVEKLEALMSSIPKQLGQKFVYSQLGVDFSQYTIKQALALFNKARICHPVISCSANGIPLGAELREKFFKEIFLDMGLVSSALGLSLDEIETTQ